MTPVGFECLHCHHRLSVSAEWVGKAVRCPKCQVVMKIPSPGPASSGPPPVVVPPQVIPPRNVPRSASDTDSIFSDSDEGDGESLFSGSQEVRRPILPAHPPDATQSTIRVPGVADPLPVVKPPAPPVVMFPDEPSDPFGTMVDEVMSRPRRGDEESEAHSEFGADAEPAHSSGWMKWAIVGVSVYAGLATVAAVWGWTRPLAEKPPVMAPKR